ncbi:MAG: hypothetical protein ABI776_18930 [Nocardioidaceae bacterium]
MILAVALVPHPPLLLRELGGAQDPVADLRAAVLAAVRAVTAGAEEVVVVGPAAATGGWDVAEPFDVRRYGATGERPARRGLPLSLGVGRRVLGEAGWTGPVELVAVASDASTPDLEALADRLADRPGRTALLMLGDGSASRGEGAPGYLDERAFPFDDALARSLADGDATALLGLDVALAEELVVLGAATFRLLGAVGVRTGTTYETAVGFRGDPYGVSYLVATWRLSEG